MGVAVHDDIFTVDAIPATPIKVFASAHRAAGGGPAATAAAAIARLGGSVALWARVGDDATGRMIAAELAGYGVDVSQMRCIPGAASGQSTILVDAQGERLIATFPGEGLDPDPSWLPLARVREASVVLGDMRWPKGTAALFAAAREAELPRVLDADLNPDPRTEALIPEASHAIFSAPALARLTGTADHEEGLRRAQAMTEGLVGVTDGALGFFWLEEGAMRHEPGFPVRAVDTVGAGDVFHGAFALGIAEGSSTAAAGRFANAVAALKCSRPGGRAGTPTRAEAEALLEGRIA